VSTITSTGSSASSPARARFTERSMLDVNPRIAAASRPVLIAAGIVAVALAVATTARQWTDVDLPWLMVVALLVLLLACVLLARATDPTRAEFSTSTHTLVVALTCLAGLLSAAAQWEGNSFLRDDWGQLSLGIVLLAASPYRPVRHLIVAGVVCGGFVGALALGQSTELPASMSPVSFAIIAAVPVLSLSLAGAAYAHAVVQAGPRPTPAGRGAGSVLGAEPRGVAEIPVRAELLSKDVEPFLRRIVEGGAISSRDAADAETIADSIRLIMVAEANRSWLGTVVADLASRGKGSTTSARLIEVHDPARLSDAMAFEQRTAVRAVLAVLLGDPAFAQERPGHHSAHPVAPPHAHQAAHPLTHLAAHPLAHRLSALRASVAVLPGGHKRLLVNATFTLPPHEARPARVRQWWRRSASLRSIRRTVNPLLALTQSAFPWQDLIVDSSGNAIELTLRFSYGHEVERAVASDMA
jgi:hypothetical protein